jgi:Ca2+-binding RTX toxin-like protein
LKLRALGAIAAAIAFTSLAGTASAATLTNSGGTLTYAATDDSVNYVGFHESGTNTVIVRRYDGDNDSVAAPAGCTGGATSGDVVQSFTCTGVTRVVVSTGDLGDRVDAGGNDDEFSMSALGGFTPLSRLTTIPIEMNLGDGDDLGTGGNASDIIRGEEGNDTIQLDRPGGGAPGGNDQGFGGGGSDNISGSRGADTINGDGDNDIITGGPDDDILAGGEADDQIAGGPGADKLFGNGGNDTMEGECYFFACSAATSAPLGSDEFSGGDGLDTVFYFTQPAAGPPSGAVKVTVTLDDVANDGRAGEPVDNVRSDVETVDVSRTYDPGAPQGSSDLRGSEDFDQFIGSAGADTMNPLSGSDFVTANAGDDNIDVFDGFADTVDCGAGTDTVKADQFDTLTACENVTRTTTQSATTPVAEDRPPTGQWVRPVANAVLSTTAVNVLEVNAVDDRGISQVQFVDDERVVCVDFTAPYTCNYRPQGDDVGRNTLAAIIIDTGNQTATLLRSVRVPLFVSPRLTARTTPKRDKRSPYRFTTSGRLSLPAGVAGSVPYEIPGGGGVTSALGCKGTVAVQFKAGKKTVSNRRVKLSRSCTYRSRVTFTIPSRIRPKTLRVFVKFNGNDVIAARRAALHTVRTR